MKVSFPFVLISFFVLFILAACKSTDSNIPKNDEQAFNTYWNQGKAEISTYNLDQSRYGSQHDGTVVIVFVTEEFSKKKAVKLDEPDKHKGDAVNVMKCNMNKEFVTGIYQYNMMSSVFTPLDYKRHPHSLKLVSSSQEWCGQTFLQVNWERYRYEAQQFSYFESEGDRDIRLVNTWLEDEFWNKIRVAPDQLPIGKIKVVPSAFYLRLSHTKVKVYDAVSTLIDVNGLYTYSLQYPDLGRTLKITFEKVFPYKILNWKESYGKNETTTATLSKTILSDYWNQNHPDDETLRDSLQLGNTYR
jgi:hypothetical protein